MTDEPLYLREVGPVVDDGLAELANQITRRMMAQDEETIRLWIERGRKGRLRRSSPTSPIYVSHFEEDDGAITVTMEGRQWA